MEDNPYYPPRAPIGKPYGQPSYWEAPQLADRILRLGAIILDILIMVGIVMVGGFLAGLDSDEGGPLAILGMLVVGVGCLVFFILQLYAFTA